jgi:hypothetical protein
MNKVLDDPIAPKKRVSNKNYVAPTKAQAHSGLMSAGDNYGIGFRMPIGKEKASGLASGRIPQKSHCFSPDKIFYGEDKKG